MNVKVHRISHTYDFTKTVFREKGKYKVGTDDSLKKNHLCVHEINHYGLYFKTNNIDSRNKLHIS